MPIYEMKNPIKNYAWGSTTFLSSLSGAVSQSTEPQAELWMGTHPQGISEIKCDDVWLSLESFISKHPDFVFGESYARQFNNKLPFLFKILAIESPLSIQVHPDKDQASDGYERDNQANIPRSAHNRNFKDKSDKPELVCALTPLWAMCGFRKYETIRANFLSITDNNELCLPNQTIHDFFRQLMQLDSTRKHQLIRSALQYAQTRTDHVHWKWVLQLADSFPKDIGVLAPLYLNTICLNPGEGLFIQPGVLHSYLDGNAVEIMCNSDNVIRGGLTVKHIDVETLLDIVSTRSEEFKPIQPQMGQFNEWHYVIPMDSFSLRRFDILKDHPLQRKVNGPEVLLCIKGNLQIHQGNQTLPLQPGRSVFVCHQASSYKIEGDGVVFQAGVK